MDDLQVKTGKVPILINKLELNVSNASLSGINTREPVFYGHINGQWNSLSLNKPTDNGFIEITGLSGKLDDFSLSIPAGEGKKPFENVIDKMNLTGGRLHYTNGITVATISNITGTAKEGMLELKDVEIKPEATLAFFLKTTQWQKDYLTFNCDKIVLKKINNQALLQDTALFIQQVYLYNPRLSSYRDKNMAFRHGVEKGMPTQLITGIKMPLQIDTIYIKGASVNVHEVSEITKREGIVPLSNIDASFKNFTNRPGEKDSLIINLSGRVIDYNIRTFRYAESYQDSLSGFRMNYNISPMHLPMLTQVTGPLSAIAVTRGFADTLYARVSGNKYATFGEINFYYHNLGIRILNKKDTRKKDLLLAFESVIANSLIIRSNNKKQANMFFVRNREKFVFNYWVKTLFSGLFTSAGAKKSSKYKRMYEEVAEKYSLPR